MTRTWLPLTFVVLLIAGITLFLLPEGGQKSGSEKQAEGSPVETPVAADFIHAAPKVEPQGDQVAEAATRVTISTPHSKAATIYATPPEEGLLITALDGDTQKPLPYAEILVIDSGVSDMRRLETEMSLSPDFERVFENLGVIYKTDSNAQVRIPPAIDTHIIAGRTPTHFNLSFDIDKDSEDFTLYLNPTEILRVKVVDPKGNPVEGAPVSLRVRNNRHSQDFTTAYSNKDGIAELKLFQLLLMELADDETYAALLVLSNPPVETRVHVKELPEELPVLVLKEAGQVEVRVVDHQGESLEEDFMVNMNLLLPEDTYDDKTDFVSWNDPREHLTGRTKNGVAYFPLVDFDQRLRIMVVSHDGERRAEAFGGGPVRNGGPAIFTLIPEAQTPVIIGRILNAEGAIGPNLNLEYRMKNASEGGSNSSHSGTIRTDENGEFRLLMEEEYEDDAVRSLTVTMRATKKKPMRTVVVDLSYVLAPGENDLGDLVVTVPPLIASGTVVDSTGTPIRGANILLEHKYVHGDGPDDFWWNEIWEFRAETDRSGNFSIRGTIDPKIYRVTARHETYLDESLPMERGQEGIHLTMKKSVTVKGRFLLDENVDPTKLQVSISFPDKNRPGKERGFRIILQPQGKFEFKNLPPGPAVLTLRSEVFEEVFFRQDILLQAYQKETQTLEEIDLRGVFREVRLWVKNLQGELIPKLHIWPSHSIKSHSNENNPFVAITMESGLDFQVAVPGYQVENLVQVMGEHELIMKKGFPIRADITNLSVLPSGWGLQLRFKAVSGGEKSADPRLSHRIKDIGRNAKPSYFMAPGTYSVRFIAVDNQEGGNGTPHWLPEGNLKIEVEDILTLQNFTFTIDEEALANTIANK